MLPSEALSRATTFDLNVLDISTRWLTYRQDIAEGRTGKNQKNLTNQEMLDMIKRAREQQ